MIKQPRREIIDRHADITNEPNILNDVRFRRQSRQKPEEAAITREAEEDWGR